MRLILPVLAVALIVQPVNVVARPAKSAKTASVKKPQSGAAPVTRAAVDSAIAKAVADPGRKADDRARDKYRHPGQTLTFFGLKPDMTVVEMLPGGGWYSAILAPYLAGQGHYVAAVPAGEATDTFQKVIADDPSRYSKAEITPFVIGQPNQLVPASTADMVLTFRNIHNLLGSPEQPGDGNAPQAFTDWFAALKPGGILGIVEHRLPEGMDSALEKTSGYVKRSTVIRLAMAAGFQLAGASMVNANPKDMHDWPKGVWTLPPTYALGAQDRAKYTAIGESDRMTLKFIKPDPNAAPSAPESMPAGADSAAPASPPPADAPTSANKPQ